jgi:pyruvate kinase
MNKTNKTIRDTTIGPSSEDEDSIRHLISLGVNVFRLNFKHNDVAWHKATIQKIHSVCEGVNVHIGVLLDLQGPEIRIVMSQDEIRLEKDVPVEFGTSEFSITHPEILKHIEPGQEVVVNDGQFHLTFEHDISRFRIVQNIITNDIVRFSSPILMHHVMGWV